MLLNMNIFCNIAIRLVLCKFYGLFVFILSSIQHHYDVTAKADGGQSDIPYSDPGSQDTG